MSLARNLASAAKGPRDRADDAARVARRDGLRFPQAPAKQGLARNPNPTPSRGVGGSGDAPCAPSRSCSARSQRCSPVVRRRGSRRAGRGPRIDRGERTVIRAINRARSLVRPPQAARRPPPGPRRGRPHAQHAALELLLARGVLPARAPLRALPPHRRDDRYDLALLRAHRRADVAELPPHRAVLLSRNFRRVGVGRRLGSLGATRACIFTADFASRR